MVRYLHSPTTEEEEEEEKEAVSVEHQDPQVLQEFENFSSSFTNSFLDFDSINSWFVEESPDLEGNSEVFGDFKMNDLGEKPVELCSNNGEFDRVAICERDEVKNELSECLEQENGVLEMDKMGVCQKITDARVLSGVENLGLIEEHLEKVCLTGASNSLEPMKEICDTSSLNGGEIASVVKLESGKLIDEVLNGNEMKSTEKVGNEDESDSDSESEDESSSSSASSSSSSSDDEESESTDDEKKTGDEKGKMIKKEMNLEEGEIVLSDEDEMIGWSDHEEGTGPIASKNEIKLPPIPPITATLQPHHQTLPVGVILSILGAQVIVEGVEKHNPLNEGSILWITETRSPLGIIDEIFGPVKNPYYIVRYNSENEVPTGIHQGTTLISFVPEFANHVLNDKSLYQKGYDASGENDEELSDALEFSDDEKEAEYKRMIKNKKRGVGANESNQPKNKRKEKNQFKKQTGNYNNGNQVHGSNDTPPLVSDPKVPMNENRPFVSHVDNSLSFSGDQSMVPPFPGGVCAPNGIWGPQLQNGISSNGMMMPFLQQNQPFQLYPTPLQPGVGFHQQQNGVGPNWPMNFGSFDGQSNFGFQPGPIFPGQNMFNPFQFGMGLPAQGAPMLQNMMGQAPQNMMGQVPVSNDFEFNNNNNNNNNNDNNNNMQQSRPHQNAARGRGGGGGGGRRGGFRSGDGRGRSQNR